MNNLMPEKRMDKNGSIVTRHVSIFNRNKKAATVPEITAQPIDQLHPEQLVERDYIFTTDQVRPSPALKAVCKQKSDFYKFTASDKTFYAMLRAVSVDDAIVLLSRGIDMPMKAITFLKKKKLDHLIVDSEASRILSRAIYRGIPADNLIEVNREYRVTPSLKVDAAEAYGMKSLRQYNLWRDIAHGALRLEHVKALGEERIEQNYSPEDILYVLREINIRGINVDIDKLAPLLEKMDDEQCSPTYLVYILECDAIEKFESIHSVKIAGVMASSVFIKDEKPEDRYKSVLHYDAIVHLAKDQIDVEMDWEKIDFKDSVETRKAGLNPEEALDCINKGMTANQYLAVRDNGIAPSVSGGWL